MIAAAILGLLGAAALVWFLHLVATAPLGWQDDEGFHEGERQSHDEGHNK